MLSGVKVSSWLWRILAGLVALACLDWLALRRGWLPFPPGQLAGLVALVLILALAGAGLTAVRLWRRRLRVGTGVSRLMILCGLIVAGAGGLANWLLSLQGVVVLAEGEAVPLSSTAHLQEFEAGPLADIDEMRLTLELEELELVPAGGEGFFPRSLLRVAGEDGVAASLRADRFQVATFGSVRFHQGAFGFAPRIVVLHQGREILDRVIPFLSRQEGRSGISFEERFTISRERLEIEGAVDLGSLDEGMRGHAALLLTVRREGELLGRGSLLPGHFAEIEDGYRIGFADLHRWSEIDISRRNYGGVVIAGALLLLVGAPLWPLAAWRRW